MKIAICYSGNLRTYEHCVKNHLNKIGDSDIYISTWDEISRSNKINDPWHNKIDLNISEKIDANYINKVTPSSFNIKAIKIDNYKDCPLKNLKSDNHLNYQYFKIKDCFNLIEKDIEKYDFIIRLRPDITIQNISFDENHIIFNEYIWYNYQYAENRKAINEMIWISTPDLARKPTMIYDNLDKINNSIDSLYGEAACYSNLKIENILDKVKIFNFKYNVVR
jgi:hypothetical protein